MSLADRIYLGDYVQDDFGRRGRVNVVYPHGCPQSDDWLSIQSRPREQYRYERWVSILVHDGGAVVVPEAVVTKIPPFDFTHRDVTDYFNPEEQWQHKQ